MRKLGKGQTVMFCAPKEVQRQIRLAVGKDGRFNITVPDVLKWCIKETIEHTKNSAPLWATQGVRYQRRLKITQDFSSFKLDDEEAKQTILQELAVALEEPEAQTIMDRYGIEEAKSEYQRMSEELAGNEAVALIVKRVEEFGESVRGQGMHEEQERELQPEQEREQEIERPSPMKAKKPHVCAEAIKFVETGVLENDVGTFIPAFQSLSRTSTYAHYDDAWPSDALFVTREFSETVLPRRNDPLDQFVRPVEWVLKARNAAEDEDAPLVILAPHEVNELIPKIKELGKVSLHVFSAKTTKSMPSLERLTYCSIPSGFKPEPTVAQRIQLNLFSGSLYLEDWSDYKFLCSFLGTASRQPREGIIVQMDGFIDITERSKLGINGVSPFLKSPIPFLLQIIAMRRRGNSFEQSHLGRILHGKLLQREDFPGFEDDVEPATPLTEVRRSQLNVRIKRERIKREMVLLDTGVDPLIPRQLAGGVFTIDDDDEPAAPVVRPAAQDWDGDTIMID